jgi:drug/metabolite transporter (DMT)-like permease
MVEPNDALEVSGSRPALRAHLALLVMVVIWAVNFSVAKEALAMVSPLAFNALRFLLAAVIVSVALRQQQTAVLPERADRLRVFLLGLLGNVLYQLFFVFGLANTRAGTASILLSGTPILTALLSAAAGHERVAGRVWIGVVAACGGIILVVTSGGLGARGETLQGDLLLIGATLTWAIYSVGSRNLIRRYGAVPVTAWTLWAGTIGICVVGIPDVVALELRRVPLRAWLAIGYAGALSVGVAYMLWSYGVRQLGNTRTAAYSNLVPVLALAVAWLWLRERPAPGQLLGAAVIIGGVTLAQTSDRLRLPFAARSPPP